MLADNACVAAFPAVVADGSPGVVKTHFHSSLILVRPVHQLHLAIVRAVWIKKLFVNIVAAVG